MKYFLLLTLLTMSSAAYGNEISLVAGGELSITGSAGSYYSPPVNVTLTDHYRNVYGLVVNYNVISLLTVGAVVTSYAHTLSLGLSDDRGSVGLLVGSNGTYAVYGMQASKRVLDHISVGTMLMVGPSASAPSMMYGLTLGYAW